MVESQLAAVRRDCDRLQRGMYEAVQLQRKLCGPRVLRRGSFEICSEIFPVCDISGDFTCLYEHNADLMFAIGDIAGKGLSAGMWFTHVVSMVRLQIEALGDPAAALSVVNRELLLTTFGVPPTTIFLAQLNTSSGQITYCNAGHPPALILRAQGHVECLQEGGIVLGVLPEAHYVTGMATLEPGDTLLGYSDGIAECLNEVGTEFGAERIVAVAQHLQAAGASSTLFSILGAAEDFAGGKSRDDDMALIVVRRGRE
jgi:sigma-B regulation protein RsbU (phosphoserine phosphatase)